MTSSGVNEWVKTTPLELHRFQFDGFAADTSHDLLIVNALPKEEATMETEGLETSMPDDLLKKGLAIRMRAGSIARQLEQLADEGDDWVEGVTQWLNDANVRQDLRNGMGPREAVLQAVGVWDAEVQLEEVGDRLRNLGWRFRR